MADENQNAEMEDILSSIKNILEDDGSNQPAADVPAAETDVVDDILNTSSEIDDVLELSPDMRIEQTQEQSAFEEENVDVSLPEIDNTAVDSLSIGIEDEVSDSVFDEALANPAEIEQLSDTDFEKILDIEPTAELSDRDEENDDIIVNTEMLPEQPEESTAQEDYSTAESDIVIEPAPFNDAEISFDEPTETAPVIETELAPVSVALPVEEPAAEPVVEEAVEEPVAEPVVEETVDMMPSTEEPVVEDVIEQPVTTEVVEETSKADAADVSAGIISNFAKMFSREEPAVSTSATVQPTEITSVGNAGKTLEEFVLESISKVIGQEISRQWNDGASFKALAEAEVNRQTKEWINDNLPTLVEKVVKQEIERVIAKVGS